MITIRIWTKRHSLALFLALTYLLSWLPQLFGGGLFPFGPLLAALAVLALTGGRVALGDWWDAVTRWRGGLSWYALALGLPFAINGAAAGLAVLLGAAVPSPERFVAWPDLLVNFVVYLLAFGPSALSPVASSAGCSSPCWRYSSRR